MMSNREWRDIGIAVAVWFLILVALLWALPVIVMGTGS